jgi:tetratricopeptide (TPR) repeat protein
MLRPKKKISKRELKEDKLVTWYVNVTTWYEKHKKNISIAITVLVLAIVATVVFVKNRSDNNERAMAQLGDVYALFDNGQYQAAIDGVPERNIPGLKSIVENYGSSPSGELARFYLANAYYHMGRYDEALKHFEDFSASDEMLTVSRYAGIAGCFEAKGAFKEAAENFEKAATKYAKDVNAAENLNNAARNFGLVGDKEKAIELYKRLKKNYPTSVYAREADRFIMQLSV